MSKSTDLLIEELANDLKPGRHWHPVARASFWTAVFFAISIGGMAYVQAFRPNFVSQIVQHVRFSLEMVSVFLVCNFLIYFVFSFMVPGRKKPRDLYALTGVLALIWLVTQWMAFGSETPGTSYIGAREDCVSEVYIWGGVGVVFLFYFVRKAQFPFALWQYFIMGFVSGLIPGALMQLACLYDPRHGLTAHYGPAIAVGVVAMVVMPLLKKIQ